MQAITAYRVSAGRFVIAEGDSNRVICLKAEREGKDHINHFLVPLDPVSDRRALRLIYLDPEQLLLPLDGLSFAFTPGTDGEAAQIGDALTVGEDTWLKVLDDPASQRLYSYVDLASGQVRPRMERQTHRLAHWRIERL